MNQGIIGLIGGFCIMLISLIASRLWPHKKKDDM